MRKINAIVFAVGRIALLLPFMELSCGNNTLMVVTGKQLITGFSVNLPSKNTGQPQNSRVSQQKFRGNKYAWGVLALLVLSLLIAIFVKIPIASYLLVLLSALGAGLLLLLRSTILQRAAARGAGLIAVRFREGFWLLLGVFSLGFLINLFFRGRKD